MSEIQISSAKLPFDECNSGLRGGRCKTALPESGMTVGVPLIHLADFFRAKQRCLHLK